MAKTRFMIDGMDCASCAAKIDKAARRVPGVTDVSVSATTGTMVVEHEASVDLENISRGVTGLGYGVRGYEAAEKKRPADRTAEREGIAKQNHGEPHDTEHDHAGHDHSHHDHLGHDHPENDHSGHDRSPHKHTDAATAGHAGGTPVAVRDAEVAGIHGHDHGADDGGPWWSSAKARLTITCGIALGAAFLLAKLAPATEPWAYIIAMAVGLVPIARRAISAAMIGMPFTIETLMTVAAIGAVAIGASEEAAVVVFLFLVGELLEGMAASRARASIKALATLVPKTALLEIDGRTKEVPADQLKVGSIILVRPGDRIPADGTIISGDTSVDEAPVTGESVPKRKGPDDAVYAGTINQDAAIRVTVTAAAQDNTISRIIRLVEEAQESKAPTERFIDRFSKYYTPGVMVVALLITVVPPLGFGGDWSEWIYKGLAVLLIGCPCALVISTPAAIAASLSAGARRGMLMKGGAVLESFRTITKVAFDKTGTLTAGKPKVTDIVGVSRSKEETLRLAADLEVGSSHPLALAILGAAKDRGIEPTSATDARAIGGEGVVGKVGGVELFLGSPQAAAKRAKLPDDLGGRITALNDAGKTVSILLAGSEVAGLIAMRDEPREDARRGIEALRELGISAVMLTGDNKRTAAAIAADLGLEPRAELLPQDKQRIVGELQAAGERVAKVGDGINDAPALAAADVGIAMGGGTDVALETADAAVLHGRVLDIAGMVMLSRATMTNIWQNITIALGLKAVFLVTTVLGITGLWPAILADTGATVFVTANAMRLLAWRGPQ
jgi:Cd2+/Zn2+-exporting ATPase